MNDTKTDLGRLISVHPVAPIYVQRAVFIALLSLIFFFGMMLAYYIRQSALYFLLATAFLVVYLFTMFSWFSLRKSIVQVFENGLEYRSRRLRWSDIAVVESETKLIVKPRSGAAINLPMTLADRDRLVRLIRSHLSSPADSN